MRISRSDCLIDGPRKAPEMKTVPDTEAGGWVENTKAYEITTLKELGKMTL